MEIVFWPFRSNCADFWFIQNCLPFGNKLNWDRLNRLHGKWASFTKFKTLQVCSLDVRSKIPAMYGKFFLQICGIQRAKKAAIDEAHPVNRGRLFDLQGTTSSQITEAAHRAQREAMGETGSLPDWVSMLLPQSKTWLHWQSGHSALQIDSGSVPH